MKKIFLLLFAVTLFFACDKDKDKPAPELSTQVAGNYKVTRLSVDGTNLPLNNASIDLKIEKFAAEVVTGEMTLKMDGTTEAADLGTLTLKNAGNAGIDIYEGTDKVGTLDKSNKLTFALVYDGQDLEMVADKL